MSGANSNTPKRKRPNRRPMPFRRQLAELLIAGDAVLNKLALRNANSPQIDDLKLTEADVQILSRFDWRLLSDERLLRAAVSRRRDANLLRQAGVHDLPNQLDRAQVEVSLASQEEFRQMCQHAAASPDSDITLLSRNLEFIKKKRIVLERNLADLASRFDTLVQALPEYFESFLGHAKDLLDKSALGRAFHDASAEIDWILIVIQGLGRSINSTNVVTSGEWWSYLQATVPEAIVNGTGRARTIDKEIVRKHLDWLLTVKLAELHKTWNERHAELMRTWSRWESVGRDWAVQGTVDCDALAKLLALDLDKLKDAKPS